jgi:hypothetical protein
VPIPEEASSDGRNSPPSAPGHGPRACGGHCRGWVAPRQERRRNPGGPGGERGPGAHVEAQLQRLAASVDHPVYWAGPRPGFSYELTRTTTGRIFVRYLPHGIAAGDSRPDFLTVGTYPGERSFADLRRAANREGAAWVGLDHGGLVVFAARNARSTYLGYPSKKYQVEVFAPPSDTARKLVLGGAIVPVR